MATQTAKPQRFLLLPPRGLQTSAAPASAHLGPLMVGLAPKVAPPASLPSRGLKVLDSVHENGIKLVEMTDAAMRQVREQAPGLRIVPEVFYQIARAPLPAIAHKAAGANKKAASSAPAKKTLAAAATGPTVLSFLDSQSKPVAGAKVLAFTDFAARAGAEGTTRANGSVALNLGSASKVQRLFVLPKDSVWPLVKSNVKLPRTKAFQLARIDLSTADSLQHFAAQVVKGDGAKVVVGIIDTGVGPHKDVPVAGGVNTVIGENAVDFSDNGDLHGTHVAGIVGARGAAPAGMRGLAPAATVFAYRVFGKGSDGASNFSIAKAIDRAISDGCDLINMSLAGGPADPAISASIADARAAGVVVICASGNDAAGEVSNPGADSRAIAVGAFGRKGLMPSDSVSASRVGRLGKDKTNFMADFSNHGFALDLAGPGVGVVSTVPVDRWAVMDGTSMACPAVTGAVARLLSTNPALLNAPRNQQRSDSILQMVFQAAKQLGFGAEFEGSGWPTK